MAQSEQHDFTAAQNDYAIFLPAISSFYATFIGRQRHEQYVDPARMPAQIQDMEALNFLNRQQALFPYQWALYSAGHADLDLTRANPKEDMLRDRDPTTTLLCDSGGFQIAKGVWEGDWRANSGCPRAQKKREAVLKWQDGLATYGLTLDIPTWTSQWPGSTARTQIHDYTDAVNATIYNNDYFIANRRGVAEGGSRFLNVLQGANHSDADSWYETMKHYSDPARYPGRHFDGWGMGGQNMCDVHLILRRLVALRYDNLLQPGVHDWMHFLGTSKLEWAVLLTVLQRAIRRHVNPRFTISFDCASPFLATANGQVYYKIDLPENGKWSYKMSPIVDDRRWSNDTRLYGAAALAEGWIDHFDESPVSLRCQLRDICVYQPNQANKNGKVAKTSWDSFSYALLMAHNVWLHLESVQRANREFDAGRRPAMMWNQAGDHARFEDIVEDIFSAPDRATAESRIERYDRYWMDIVGTRGLKGKKTKNATTQFNLLFEVGKSEVDNTPEDAVELDEGKLDQLEQEQT
jgi:hypothetical protein